MNSLEKLEKKLINKKYDQITDSEPGHLKEKRKEFAQEMIGKSNENYLRSSFPSLLEKTKGLVNGLEIRSEAVWYQKNGKFKPHFSVKLMWDRKQNELKSGMSFKYEKPEKGETHKEITINSFPNGDLFVKGHPLFGTTILYFYYVSGKDEEKALTKAIEHPKIKWERKTNPK
jgi:hypothetical protein